ncbi:hypothetical protein [Natronospora cellulosivora (SeqCode)]
MKREISVIILLSVILVLTSISISAEENLNVISFDGAGLLLGNITINYENVLSDSNSFKVGGSISSLNALDYNYSGFGLKGEYRFYREEEAPKGMYYGPISSFSFLAMEDNYSKVNLSLFTIGGVVGYQWIYDSNITLDLSGGINYCIANISDDYYQVPFSGILPALYLTVGFAF